MCLVLDIAAMLIKQLRQNGPGVSLKTGPLTLQKFINITKILILHGGGHSVSVNASVDALELIQNNSMMQQHGKEVSGVHRCCHLR